MVWRLVGVRQAAAVEPEALVVADGVHDQRVAVPPADGVAVVGGREVGRVRPSVHVDGAERVRAADVEDVDALGFGQLDELHAVGRQELPRRPRRLAPRVRLELVLLPIVVHRLGPRLKRHGRRRGNGIEDAEDRQPHALVGHRLAGESRPARRVARRRLRRRRVAAPGVPTPPITSCVPPPASAASALPTLGTLSAPAALLGIDSVRGQEQRDDTTQHRTDNDFIDCAPRVTR